MKRSALCFFLLSPLFAQLVLTHDEVKILALRVSFPQDNSISSTGDGRFLEVLSGDGCGGYTIDPPPHNRDYFHAQIEAVDNYFRNVSRGRFGIDLDGSKIMPQDPEGSYEMSMMLSEYHPYAGEELQDEQMAEFFREAVELAYEKDEVDYDAYDLLVIFHAGIGQDFSLPFLDPTPEDIPSTYIDAEFLQQQLSVDKITLPDGSSVSSGIILPETQNHLLYDIAEEVFFGVDEPCDYQFGLTGTFALMMGFAIGLPPLWEIEKGVAGVGVFALMDQGSNNGRGLIPAPPDPWTRIWAGWETTTTVTPGTVVELLSRDAAADKIVRAEINGSEYFLIENRNNWVSGAADVDSLRWKNRDADNIMPPYAEILLDSVNIGIDETSGVIAKIPDYDIGLPASGLLIWHIDESKIAQGLGSYAVNIDRDHRGIDLEEADGAQDIGYPSLFIFTDPSIGLWSDMWFDGNSQYTLANPAFADQPPSFGPDTYPNTRANNGADSFIEINNIAVAGKTMTFSVENSLVTDGFPDSSLGIQFFYDFDGDGQREIIGGKDSLWWSGADLIVTGAFHKLHGKDFQLSITNDEVSPHLAALEDLGDSLHLHLFSPAAGGEGGFDLLWTQTVHDTMPGLLYGFADEDELVLEYYDEQLVNRKSIHMTEDSVWTIVEDVIDVTQPFRRVAWELSYQDDGSSPISGIASVHRDYGLHYSSEDGEGQTGFQMILFNSLGIVDIDLDGRLEFLATDTDGTAYVINSNMTHEFGFPLDLHATSAVLARDLFGDAHPEIVLQVEGGDIVVVDWGGRERYRLSNSKESELRMVTEFKGKSAVVAESVIWQFDDAAETSGNEWPMDLGSPTHSAEFVATFPSPRQPAATLMDNNRTYNYPNPVQEGSTTIRVFVESAEKVEIRIYDVAGFFVEKLTMDDLVQGEVNEIVWDVQTVESGLYFANVEATQGAKSEKKILKISVIH